MAAALAARRPMPWAVRGPAALGHPRAAGSLVDRGEGMAFSKHLVDTRRVHAMGGRGADGALRYIKHKKHIMVGPGWPCGGNGGRGGDVVVKASSGHHSLAHIGGDIRGSPGLKSRKQRINGAAGEDAVILVPRGVIVRELIPVEGEEDSSAPDAATGDVGTVPGAAGEAAPRARRPRRRFERGGIIAEIDRLEATATVAAGGRGGTGNNMARPHDTTPGFPGEDRWVELELKLIADVGLVGKPNAGKSTLLGSLSRACPKIAPYPFTTVAPYVGRAEFADGSVISIADVPGLVEGAHMGEGLGHEFLRHLERTKLLLYLVDASHSQDLFLDFLALQREVALYSHEMAAKPCGVLATKCDLAPDLSLQRADRLFHAISESSAALGDHAPLFVRAISARFAHGVPGLLQELRRILQGQHEAWLRRVAASNVEVAEDIEA